MNPIKLILGFVPLIAFSVLVGWLPVGWAAVVGLVLAVAVAAVTAPGGIKILPVAQAVVLAVIAVIGFSTGTATNSFLETYGRGLASLALGSFIVLTAVRFPFTAQFARSAVPAAQWHTETFLRINRRLSLAWGAVVLVLGAGHLAGAFLTGQGTTGALHLLVSWGVPVVAILWVVKFTRDTVAASRPAAARPQSPTAR